MFAQLEPIDITTMPTRIYTAGNSAMRPGETPEEYKARRLTELAAQDAAALQIRVTKGIKNHPVATAAIVGAIAFLFMGKK